jgi:hypothetical protein
MALSVTVRPADYDQALIFAGVAHSEGGEREFMSSNLRLYNYWGASFWVARQQDGIPVTLVVARPSKAKRKNAWGRYVNHYLVYTRKPYRLQGYAKGTTWNLRRQWADNGQSRLKSLIQSWEGFCYHRSFGDPLWGQHKGELVVDAPLVRGDPFPPGVPIESRPYSDGQLSDDALLGILTDPNGQFKRHEKEVTAVLAKPHL